MFDINNFNVIQDENYYYVFRSLEAGDISDINTGITNVMRTDRERYKLNARYNEDSNISLNEMHDHIKIHYRKDTNCISFTTNAGIAIMYGRDKETYKDNKEYDKARERVLEKLEVATQEEYYDKMDEKNIIKSARINIQALQTSLSKGYLLEKDVLEYPSYKEYVNIKKK